MAMVHVDHLSVCLVSGFDFPVVETGIVSSGSSSLSIHVINYIALAILSRINRCNACNSSTYPPNVA